MSGSSLTKMENAHETSPSVPDRIRTMNEPIDVPDSARAMLSYDPDMHAAPPETMGQAIAILKKDGTFATEAAVCAMPTFFVLLMTTMPETVVLHAMSASDLVTGATMACVAALTLPFGVLHWRRSILRSARSADQEKFAYAKLRIRAMASKPIDQSRLETFKKVLDLVDRPTKLKDRATVMKLEAVAIGLDRALGALGPDMERRKEVQIIAEEAVVSIMSEIDTRTDGYDARAEGRIRSLRAMCVDVSSTKDVPETAPPSARISRVLSIARKALRTNPDLVDTNGSRIDALVDAHVPRLLSLRAAAIETAPADGLDAVDEMFSKAFESVQSSIEEAISSIHGDAMDALATEMRFLGARRGEPERPSAATPLLSAVS
jgi:hypothetical protein